MRIITAKWDHWPRTLYPQEWTIVIFPNIFEFRGKCCKLMSFNGRVIGTFNAKGKSNGGFNKLIKLRPGPYLIWNNRVEYSLKLYTNFDLSYIGVST